MTNKNDYHESKCEKLCDFKNWPQWADLTQAILEEEEVWDGVDRSRHKSTTATQTRIKNKDNVIYSKIIKQEVNSDLYTIILKECDPHQS